jgi:thiol:disulfide interchange protein DsbD
MKSVIAFGAAVCRCAFVALLASTAALSSAAAVKEPELLEPEKAFQISTRAFDENNVEVRFAIADGYYMYRDRFRFETASGRLLADVELPKGKPKEDPFFGKTEIYRREARIRVPVTSDDKARGTVKLKVTSQGCADIGVCYVPLEQFVEARLPGRSSGTPGAARQGGAR